MHTIAHKDPMAHNETPPLGADYLWLVGIEQGELREFREAKGSRATLEVSLRHEYILTMRDGRVVIVWDTYHSWLDLRRQLITEAVADVGRAHGVTLGNAAFRRIVAQVIAFDRATGNWTPKR
jgi:hypothetical protein